MRPGHPLDCLPMGMARLLSADTHAGASLLPAHLKEIKFQVIGWKCLPYVVCPITNTSNKFPLHIPLDNRTKTMGVILTEHMKCLDVISRNIQFVERMPEDLLKKTLAYVKAFF